MPAPIGSRKNEEWEIGAAQAFYSESGTWFHRPVNFPAALCDPNGFVRFESESDYLSCPDIKVGKETNVRRGICKLPGYVQMRR
jgi:hypothetical protein